MNVNLGTAGMNKEIMEEMVFDPLGQTPTAATKGNFGAATTNTVQTSGVCPHCWHCPHCGSTEHPQYARPWPNYPQPYVGDMPGWFGGSSGMAIW